MPWHHAQCECRLCRLNSDPRTWNQTQISFSRKEVAKALDIYQMHFVIVQVTSPALSPCALSLLCTLIDQGRLSCVRLICSGCFGGMYGRASHGCGFVRLSCSYRCRT